MYESYVTILDIALLPFYMGIIYFFAIKKKKKNIVNQPYYKYYVPGLTVKLIGGIGVCLVYSFYYTTGGDTLNYFDGGLAMLNLFNKSPSAFFEIIFNETRTSEQYSLFDLETKWPYYWNDNNAFFVIRVTCMLVAVSFKSYVVTTVVLAWISYSGIWKIYAIFCNEFPKIHRNLAIAILFIPSVAFWGSGLLKDTITYSASCWFIYGLYNGIIHRKEIIKSLLIIFVSSFLIIAIKPYIIYCLLPGSAIWIVFAYSARIKKPFLKGIAFVFFFGFVGVGTYFIFQQIGNNLGKWSVDEVLERAVITQTDLVKDYYGGNTFDIGKFDATVPSMLSKAPAAITAGLFRPFLWDAKNPVMLVSGLENFYILGFSIILFVRLRGYKLIRYARASPLLLYSLVFSFIFAFMVGLTTPNFGSLVRYRIPAVPFFLASLFIIQHLLKQDSKLNEG